LDPAVLPDQAPSPAANDLLLQTLAAISERLEGIERQLQTTTPPERELWLSTGEASSLTGMSPKLLRNMRADGRIRPTTVVNATGGRRGVLRWNRSELLEDLGLL